MCITQHTPAGVAELVVLADDLLVTVIFTSDFNYLLWIVCCYGYTLCDLAITQCELLISCCTAYNYL